MAARASPPRPSSHNPPRGRGARARALTSVPAVRRAVAGGGGGRRRSEGATPEARRRSERLMGSAPREGPPWAQPPPCRTHGDSPVPPPFPQLKWISAPSPLPEASERPLTLRRSPRLTQQKENVPAAPSPPRLSPSSPPRPSPPPSPPSPLLPPVPPRVRRSYSRLGGEGLPLSPIAPNLPLPPLLPPPSGPPLPPSDLPGIGPGPERRRKKKVAPIDPGALEAWAQAMNREFEEAERFRLVVE